ncbi:hypothetical protein Tco_1026949 [Tanacetum coccineum]
MDFRSFMVEVVDGKFNFLLEGGLNEGRSSSSAKSINNETLAIDADPINVVHPSKFVKNIGYSNDAPSKKDDVTLIGPSKMHNPGAEGSHRKTRRVLPQASKAFSDASDPLDVDSYPNIHDRVVVVSKVVPHVAIKLVPSNEIGLLVSIIVKAIMFQGRCTAFEEVADLKEPFVLEKVHSYRPSSGKEFDEAGDDLATASYPFIAEATADPYATVEQLFSKNLKSIRMKPIPSHSKPSSLNALIN